MRFPAHPRSEFAWTQSKVRRSFRMWKAGPPGASMELWILPQMTAALIQASAGVLLVGAAGSMLMGGGRTEAPAERKLAHTVLMLHYTLVAVIWHPMEGKDWLPNLRLYMREVMK